MPDATSWLIHWRLIEEHVIAGKRLGRHVRVDSRSAAYLWQPRGITPVTTLHNRNIPILDQGDVGSCTGNSMDGCLGTDPVTPTLPAGFGPATLNEQMALRIYSAAETLDSGATYPPTDNGSSGTSVARVAKNMGLIAGFLHPLTVDDVVEALQTGPCPTGVNWYDSFDEPDANGLVSISPDAQVRGGHEPMLRGVDVEAKMFRLDNSWGAGWGDKGSFMWSFDTMDRLLHEDGDVTALVDLSQPAPTPTPLPTPPTPTPGPDSNPDDVTLATVLTPWAHERHIAGNHVAAEAALVWLQRKGFIAAA